MSSFSELKMPVQMCKFPVHYSSRLLFLQKKLSSRLDIKVSALREL